MRPNPWRVKHVSIVLALAVVSSLCAAPPAGVRCVAPDGDESNDGEGWGPAKAWPTIEYALDQANQPSSGITEIWISIGGSGHKWTPPELWGSWEVNVPLVIRGGFEGTEDAEDERPVAGPRTVLSGNWGTNGYSDRIMLITIPSAGSPTVQLDRLRFEDGGDRAHPTWNVFGAAVHASGATGRLLITDCAFADNTASEQGGAIHSAVNTLEIHRSDFDGNRALGRAPSKGGISTPGTQSFGGAIYSQSPINTGVRCTFTSNGALSEATEGGFENKGGAVYLGATTVDTKFINCVFRENRAQCGTHVLGIGGAVCEAKSIDTVPTFWINCLFTANTAGRQGGAIYTIQRTSTLNSTFAENYAGETGGGIAFTGLTSSGVPVVKFLNCIYWGNVGDTASSAFDEQMYMHSGSGYDLSHSCVQGLSTLTNGNLSTDPLFVDPSGGNFRLQRVSPVINVGEAALLPLDYADLDGDANSTDPHPYDLDLPHAREMACELDMGAYEHETSTCPADLNEDGTVSGADLGILLSVWGTAGAYGIADFNCDGTVSGADMGVMLSQWGSCESFMMMMSGESALEDLMAYLGVESVEQILEALEGMEFEEMSTLLECIIGH